MRWPFGARSTAASVDRAEEPTKRSPSDSSAAWASAPPLQRTLAEPSVTVSFAASLATHRNPSFLAPLTHRVDPSTGGAVDGLTSVVGTPVQRSDVSELAVPPRPQVKTAPARPSIARWVAETIARPRTVQRQPESTTTPTSTPTSSSSTIPPAPEPIAATAVDPGEPDRPDAPLLSDAEAPDATPTSWPDGLGPNLQRLIPPDLVPVRAAPLPGGVSEGRRVADDVGQRHDDHSAVVGPESSVQRETTQMPVEVPAATTSSPTPGPAARPLAVALHPDEDDRRVTGLPPLPELRLPVARLAVGHDHPGPPTAVPSVPDASLSGFAATISALHDQDHHQEHPNGDHDFQDHEYDQDHGGLVLTEPFVSRPDLPTAQRSVVPDEAAGVPPSGSAALGALPALPVVARLVDVPPGGVGGSTSWPGRRLGGETRSTAADPTRDPAPGTPAMVPLPPLADDLLAGLPTVSGSVRDPAHHAPEEAPMTVPLTAVPTAVSTAVSTARDDAGLLADGVPLVTAPPPAVVVAPRVQRLDFAPDRAFPPSTATGSARSVAVSRAGVETAGVATTPTSTRGAAPAVQRWLDASTAALPRVGPDPTVPGRSQGAEPPSTAGEPDQVGPDGAYAVSPQTGSPQTVSPPVVRVQSFATMFGSGGSPAAVQRAVEIDDLTTAAVPAPDPPTSGTAVPDPPAPVPGPDISAVTPGVPPPAAAAGPPAAGPDVDELAARLYEPLSARIRAELWLDRERAGLVGDQRL